MFVNNQTQRRWIDPCGWFWHALIGGHRCTQHLKWQIDLSFIETKNGFTCLKRGGGTLRVYPIDCNLIHFSESKSSRWANDLFLSLPKKWKLNLPAKTNDLSLLRAGMETTEHNGMEILKNGRWDRYKDAESIIDEWIVPRPIGSGRADTSCTVQRTSKRYTCIFQKNRTNDLTFRS